MVVKIYTHRSRANYFTTNEIGTSTHRHHAPSLLQIIMLLVTIPASFQFTSHTYINRISPYLEYYDNRIPSPLIQYQQLSTTSLHASKHQYEIGDKVLLINNEDGASYQSGIIEQKKGGWYTIYIDDNSNNRVKRRASQLIQKEDSSVANGDRNDLHQKSIDGSTHSSDDVTSGSEEVSETILPPADIIDLDSILQHTNQENNNQTIKTSTETIQQITNIHTQYNQWILFSDLHVMPSTISTCLKVLNYIHNIAIQQTNPTGILFLGDFWHHRGFVRVDCLNSILDCMAKWQVPCIMIPGNHDQIDWKGVEHALTPLGNAYRICSPDNDVAANNSFEKETQLQQLYPGPLIITHPTKFMNALFIPHIRDKQIMKSILSSTEATSSNALFVHADVKGASMNDMITSQHGLDGEVFPCDKLIYSGHFHKPHTVSIGRKKKKSSGVIRYVGSPYQTSYSESGQSKSLLLVDASQKWQCIKEIPIDIGPRYHRISSVQSFIDDSSEMKFRKGDKVAITVCQNELEEMRLLAQEEDDDTEGEKSSFDAKLEEFRNAGISVEIRDVQSQDQDESEVPSSITTTEGDVELEDLSPKATLTAYIDNEVDNEDLGEATAKKLLEMGEELLGKSSEDTSQSSPSSKMTVSELEIKSVSIRGFGSFRRETVYPLHNRGVVLLRGVNKDFGSDSNGVGKSTLAMSSLWALAGSIDPRPTQDGKVTDVVNDFSKVAEVTLIGSINSMPFQVKRMKSTTSKGSSLTFILNGSDLTRQSSKDTQQLIDEHFGTGSQMLMRTIFHGQHTIGGLLESSDAKLKEELSYLVSLEIWQESASRARSKQRKLKRKASEIEGMLSLREKDKARAEDKSQVAKVEMKRREGMLENERRILSEKEQSISKSESEHSDVESAMESVQSQLNDCGSEINSLEKELSTVLDSGSDELETLRSKLADQVEIENDARETLQTCQRKYDMATMELKSAENQLAQLKAEWDNTGIKEDVSSPPTCKTCGQPIISATAQKHIKESIKKKLSVATSEVDKARETVSDAVQSLEEAVAAAHVIGLEVQSSMKQVQEAEESRAVETNDIRKQISASRMVQARLSAEFTSLAKRAKEMSEFNLVQSRMQANLDRLSESFNSSVVAHTDCCSEVEIIKTNILELKKEKEILNSKASLYTLLGDSFGPKGIQAFVLRNIVQGLQYCSQTYLNELSDGSLQLRMHVGSNDSIIKQAAVRNLDGTWRVRPLSSMSGGQWRRCSLALSLGFIDLASKRGKLRSSLLVLDEPLTHLDSSGRQSVGKLLRKMLRQDDTGVGRLGLSTILVILQEIAAEEIEECFDQIDEVIKHGGESYVVVDENQEHGELLIEILQ